MILFSSHWLKEGKINIDTLDADAALERTKEMLNRPGKVVIAEAAFKYNNLFVRADVVVKDGDTLSVYEVKAKSYDPDKTKFLAEDGNKVSNPWVSYLYDIAFQKYVAANSESEKQWDCKSKRKPKPLSQIKRLVFFIFFSNYSETQVFNSFNNIGALQTCKHF